MGRYLGYDDLFPPRPGLGPNGRGLCRVCATEVPARRKTICSKECESRLRTETSIWYQRAQVWERDKGTCQICHMAITLLMEILNEAAKHDPGFVWGRWSIHHLLMEAGLCGQSGHLFEIDHIVPVHLGGRGHRENLRVLCIPCHKDVSRAQAGPRAKMKRLQAKHPQKG